MDFKTKSCLVAADSHDALSANVAVDCVVWMLDDHSDVIVLIKI